MGFPHGPCALVLLAGGLAAQAAVPSLEVVRTYARSSAPSRRLAWSPDDSWIASAGELGDVVIVDAATGRIARELDAVATPGPRLAFAPDGRTLAIAGQTLRLWDTSTWLSHAASAPCDEGALAWSPDGRFVAVPTDRGVVTLFAARGLARTGDLRVARDEIVWQVGFAPDGRRIAARTDNATVVLDAATGTETERFADFGARGAPFAWLADGRLVRAGARLCGLRRAPVPLHSGVAAMAVDAAGRLCLLASDKRVHGWCGDQEFAVDGTGPIAAAPDGERWARANGTTLEVFVRGELQRRTPLLHHAQPAVMAITGDGRFVTRTAPDSGIEVRTVVDDRVVPAAVASAGHPEQLFAAMSTREDPKALPAPIGGRVVHVTWAPSCLEDDHARLELPLGKRGALELPEPGRPVVRWSPDGRRIAAAAVGYSRPTQLRVLDGDDLRELRAVAGDFCDLTWLDDGHLLALESHWQQATSALLVLDAATGRELARTAFPGAARALQTDDQRAHALVTLLDRVLLVAIRR